MKKYQRVNEFTAQGINVRALMLLHSQLESDKNADNNLIPIVVFTALSIESYLNSLGSRNIEMWDDIERVSWRKKVEILHKQQERTLTGGQFPYSFLGRFFNLETNWHMVNPRELMLVLFPALPNTKAMKNLGLSLSGIGK